MYNKHINLPIRKVSTALAAILMTAMSSCVDNDYDLSDIDTTVRIPVKDLVVPINIDRIELSNILDVKEGDKLQIIDGFYAVMEKGDFSSSDISIAGIHLPAPRIPSTSIEIWAQEINGTRSLRDYPSVLTFELQTDDEEFSYHAENVSGHILGIGRIGCHLALNLTLSLPELGRLMPAVTIDGLQLQLPKGLEFSKIPQDNYAYDPQTGIFSFYQPVTTDSNGTLSLAFEASAIDAGIAADFHPEVHTLDFDGHVGIKAGIVQVDLSALQNPGQIPSPVNLNVDYSFSSIDVTSFSGTVQYDITGLNISDVNLDDLPDVLSQPGTDISLANPQIFLSINNPVYNYGLYAEAGITITPIRDGNSGQPASLDNGTFQIGRNYEMTTSYLLSPTADGAFWLPDFPSPTHIGYTSLSRVLAGNGLPDLLRIDFDSPHLPAQTVTDLQLGQSLGHVDGKYEFVAPLQFEAGSTIVYSDTESGWSSEDLDAVTIEALTVSLDLTSELPVGCYFTGYPIDAAGNRINGVAIEGANIDANASQQHVEIYITGEITRLDGIVFEARAVADASGSTLTPQMGIYLENVRPRVSGYYQKEL